MLSVVDSDASNMSGDTGITDAITMCDDDIADHNQDITDKTTHIDSIPMDERKRWLIKIIMIIRQNFREYFGLVFANQCGHFVDKDMCKEIHKYADWVQYPDGDHMLDRKTSDGGGVTFSSDGCYLFVGYHDNWIIKWNMLTFEKMTQWEAHKDKIFILIFRRGLLISKNSEHTIKIWNGYTHQLIHTLEGHREIVNSMDVDRSGTLIVTSCVDATLQVWSVKSGECLRDIKVNTDRSGSACFIGSVIISHAYGQCIKIHDPLNGKELRSITEDIPAGAHDLAINSDESMVACLNFTIIIYSWPEMKVVRSIVGGAMCGCFHPFDPDILAVDNYDYRSVEIYNVKTGERIRVLRGHTILVTNMGFSPDGRRLVSTSLDSKARVWDVSDLSDL